MPFRLISFKAAAHAVLRGATCPLLETLKPKVKHPGTRDHHNQKPEDGSTPGGLLPSVNSQNWWVVVQFELHYYHFVLGLAFSSYHVSMRDIYSEEISDFALELAILKIGQKTGASFASVPFVAKSTFSCDNKPDVFNVLTPAF